MHQHAAVARRCRITVFNSETIIFKYCIRNKMSLAGSKTYEHSVSNGKWDSCIGIGIHGRNIGVPALQVFSVEKRKGSAGILGVGMIV